MPMIRASLRRIPLAAGTAFALACLPVAAGAAEVTDIIKFKGTITDMGVLRGPNQIGGIEYRIEGKFICRPGENPPNPCSHFTAPLSLAGSTLTFEAFFDEIDGWGEMLLTVGEGAVIDGMPVANANLVPLTLESSSSSKATEGKYETDGRFRPQIRSQIKNKNGEFQFNIRLDRGLSPQVAEDDPRRFPKGCSENAPDDDGRIRTQVRTRFTIADQTGVHEPIVVDFLAGWECPQPGRYHLRSR
jgi:hypothetical protein